MDPKSAKNLILRGENATVEFKMKANHPEKIVREIVAFANTDGGHLFVGVADDRTIAGLKYPDEEEYVLTKSIKELCRPVIDFDVEIIRFSEDTQILHFEIKEGKSKPYFAFLEKHHRFGKAFVRVNDKSIQASYEMRKILKEQGKDKSAISIEESTMELFRYFEKNASITLSQYRQLSGLNKRLASNKLVSLALSGALKIVPCEGEDLFTPVQ